MRIFERIRFSTAVLVMRTVVLALGGTRQMLAARLP